MAELPEADILTGKTTVHYLHGIVIIGMKERGDLWGL